MYVCNNILYIHLFYVNSNYNAMIDKKRFQ